MDFGDRIRELRLSIPTPDGREMSYAAFGRILDITGEAVRRLESGLSKSLKVDNAIRAAKYFGMSVEELVTGRKPAHFDDDPEDREYATLRQLAFAAATGSGVLNNEYVETKGGLKFKREFLAAEGIKEEFGEVIYAKGESMAPVIPNGSVVLINKADKEMRHDKVFLIDDLEEGARLKRLLRVREGWILQSDNPSYRPEPFLVGRHEVIGRAVWFGSRI